MDRNWNGNRSFCLLNSNITWMSQKGAHLTVHYNISSKANRRKNEKKQSRSIHYELLQVLECIVLYICHSLKPFFHVEKANRKKRISRNRIALPSVEKNIFQVNIRSVQSKRKFWNAFQCTHTHFAYIWTVIIIMFRMTTIFTFGSSMQISNYMISWSFHYAIGQVHTRWKITIFFFSLSTFSFFMSVTTWKAFIAFFFFALK